ARYSRAPHVSADPSRSSHRGKPRLLDLEGRIPARGQGSQLTLRWREMDSNFQYAARSIWLSSLLSRRLLGTSRCALSAFGQHDALHLEPEGFRRQACAFDKSLQFGPGQVGVDPTAEAAIRASDDILAADHFRYGPCRLRDRR